MEYSGFFNALLDADGKLDRIYPAERFAKYFASFIGNGFFGGKSSELAVVVSGGGGLAVDVLPGQGWINGYWYENTEPLRLVSPTPHHTLTRIDSVILRLDHQTRYINLYLVSGTPDANPQPPTLTRDLEFYELRLANIYIRPQALQVESIDIVDRRLNSFDCGMVTNAVSQLDTTFFGQQLNTFIQNYIQRANNEFDTVFLPGIEQVTILAQQAFGGFNLYLRNLMDTGDQAFSDFLLWLTGIRADSVADIGNLVDQLRDMLETDIATALALRITDLEDRQPTVEVLDHQHNLNCYPHVRVFQFDYGAGLGGAGIGNAGGDPMISIVPFECEYFDQNNVIIRTRKGFGVVDNVFEQNGDGILLREGKIIIITFIHSTTAIAVFLEK